MNSDQIKVNETHGGAINGELSFPPDGSAFSDWLESHLAGPVARASAGQVLRLDLSLAPRGLNPLLVETLDAAGPFGVGWPGPRIAVGPVRLVKADAGGPGLWTLDELDEQLPQLLVPSSG